MVNFKEIYHFSRFQRGSNIFQGGGGSNFFQGGPIAKANSIFCFGILKGNIEVKGGGGPGQSDIKKL